jgi:adenylate cyclase
MRPVEVGIGIHRGKVTVGNIGSQDRMEFTIVGSEVNFASRLEGLNKIYKSNIIVSESLISFAALGHDWVVHSDVQIRGVNSLVRIAAFTFANTLPYQEKGVA